MYPYWLLFFYFALGALLSRRTSAAAGVGAPLPAATAISPPGQDQPRARLIRSAPYLGLGFLFIVAMAGLRYRVGGDWGSYALMFRMTAAQPFVRALSITDPGYQVIAWFCAQLGAGVWLVNIIAASIFTWGLRRLVMQQELPALAALAAIPYLVIVVAMGYTRQAVAIGLLMGGIATLIEGGSALRFIAYGVVATLFHKTAFFLIPVVLIGYGEYRLYVAMFAVLVSAILFRYLLADSMDMLSKNYLDAQYQSGGAAIRLSLTSLCGVTWLLFNKKLTIYEVERKIWRNFSVAACILLASLYTISSSTVSDRLGLYLLPLQIVVLGRMPRLLGNDVVGKLVVFLLSFATLFVWSNYGANSFYWNPYRVVPISLFR